MKGLRWLAMGAGLGAVALMALAQQGASRPAGYHVATTVTLPGRGWDYMDIDVQRQRLYVSAGDQEDVIDAKTYKLVGTVGGLKGTHGVGISDKDGHGFTSNGGGNSMTEFDLATLKTIGETPLPIPRPDGIIYDPATDRVFASNHARAPEHAQAVEVDAKTGKVVATLDLPGQASEFAASDGRGHIYNNMEDTSELLDIDAKTFKILHRWPLAPCKNPSGLSIDRATRRLVVGCHNNMMAFVDADTGQVVATVPIGGGVDATRFDPGTKLAFSSNGSGTGTITVAHEDNPNQWTVLGNVPTESGARTMEVDPTTHTLFTVTAKFAPPKPGATGFARFRGAMIPNSFHLIVIPQ